MPQFEDISVEYEAGTTTEVTMHDGSRLLLRKLEEDYDPTDRLSAMHRLNESHEKGEVLTGIFYVATDKPNFMELLNLVDSPLATLPQEIVRPPKQALDTVIEELR